MRYLFLAILTMGCISNQELRSESKVPCSEFSVILIQKSLHKVTAIAQVRNVTNWNIWGGNYNIEITGPNTAKVEFLDPEYYNVIALAPDFGNCGIAFFDNR